MINKTMLNMDVYRHCLMH